MGFFVRNKTANDILIDDLGITIPAGTDYDMLSEAAGDVQASGQAGGDLNAQITAGNLVVLDPRDDTTELSAAQSILVVQLHNNPNWGINGALLGDLDDVDTTGATTGQLLQLNASGTYTVVPPSNVANSINFGDLADITDNAGHALGSFYILQGDGTNLVSVDGTTDNALFIPFIEDTAGNVVSGGIQTDLTLTYNTATNKIDASINDVFLRNTGDTLDSGTLNIAAGASIIAATGAYIAMVDAPTASTHVANKDYVDSVASGLDAKYSCYIGTTPGLNLLNYNPSGGTAGNGEFTGVDVTTIDGFPGVPQVNQRILVKNQTDAKQNGIYIISVVGGSPLGTSCTLERAPDFDGTPANEVSAGAFTFVENGTINANTGWVVTGTGILTINVDQINWSQFSGAGTYTAGAGLGLNGTQFYLDVNNLTSIAATSVDEIAFNDVTDNTTRKRTFSNVISDLGIYTQGNLTASDGVTITPSGDIQLDITGLPLLSTPSLLAEMVFDVGGTGIHNKATVRDFFHGLDVPHGITANGFVVRTAEDTYASRTIIASTTAGQNGLVVNNGDGVLSNPSIGLDIQNITQSTINLASTDLFIGFNGTTNLTFTGQQIADGVAAILGSLGNSYTTIQGDTGSATSSNQNDTLALIGAPNGGIITVATDSAPDNVTFALNVPGLAAGTGVVDLLDELAVGEGISTVKYTFGDVVTDLGIPNGVGSSSGILVSDGAGNYSAISIAVQGVGNQDGLSIVNGSGVAGNPTLGLDITGTPAAGEILDAADEIVVYNASTTSNQKMTGQEIASGVSAILGFDGLAVTVINGEPTLTLVDTTRGNKILSTSDIAITWSENRLGNNDWLQIAGAVDALSGYIAPMNATIVKVSAHTSNNRGNIKPILLYIDGVLNSTIGTFNGPAGEDQFIDTTLNIDVNQGQKIRLRAGSGGRIEDTVVTLWLKWRG